MSRSVVLPREFMYGSPPVLEGLLTKEIRCPTYTTLNQLGSVNNVAQIVIPESPNTFLDPSTSYISISATITMGVKADFCGTGSDGAKVPTTATVQGNAAILGSGGWSMCNRVTTYHNSNVLLDDLQSPGVFVNHFRNLSQSVSEKVGDSIIFGGSEVYQNYQNVAQPLLGAAPFEGVYTRAASAVGTCSQVVNFCLPLPGFLGAGSAGHLIPLFVGPFRLEWSCEDPLNFLWADGTKVLSPASTAATVTYNRIEFVANTVVVSPTILSTIVSSLPDGKSLIIRSNEVALSAFNIPKEISGSVPFLVGFRCTSAKAMLTAFQVSDAADKIFGSVQPSASSISHYINGTYYPQQLGDMTKPIDAFGRLMVGLGIWSTTNNKPAITAGAYSASLVDDVPVPFFRAYNKTAATLLSASNTNGTQCNEFLIFQDLESYASKNSGSGFYSGLDTSSGANFLQINFAAATTANVTAMVYTMFDCSVIFDLESRSASRKF